MSEYLVVYLVEQVNKEVVVRNHCLKSHPLNYTRISALINLLLSKHRGEELTNAQQAKAVNILNIIKLENED